MIEAAIDRNLLSTILTCRAATKETMPQRQAASSSPVHAFKGRLRSPCCYTVRSLRDRLGNGAFESVSAVYP